MVIANDEIICNKDGSYSITGMDALPGSYVFEPVAAFPEQPTEPEPTTEPEPVKIRGDVDANGVFELSDIIMMQKYLLGVGELNDYDMGDMMEDGVLDIFDLGLMKREYLTH